MKVIILAAGMGIRLMPLTKKIPKCLIEINGKTILEKIIESCLSLGINDFIIVLGHGKEYVAKHLSKLSLDFNYKTIENNEYMSTNTGVSLCIALKYVNNEEVIIMNGDIIFDKRILDMLVTKNRTTIVIDNVKKLTDESFKVSIIDNSVALMGKDILIKDANGEFIGLSLIKSEDIDYIKKFLREMMEHNKKQYYDFIFQKFSCIKQIDFVFTNELRWTEIDNFEDLKCAIEVDDWCKNEGQKTFNKFD